MLDIIKSIYQNVKSQVKHNNNLSSSFTCNTGVRKGECLSPFMFPMCLNDLEDELRINGVHGIVIDLIAALQGAFMVDRWKKEVKLYNNNNNLHC